MGWFPSPNEFHLPWVKMIVVVVDVVVVVEYYCCYIIIIVETPIARSPMFSDHFFSTKRFSSQKR